ncbi:hypothetical protein Bbelb_289830 [Branchiostoma belcheri]|nr:hypothetical protein Bbelb_289830 [Branchiostoma belcheri]
MAPDPSTTETRVQGVLCVSTPALVPECAHKCLKRWTERSRRESSAKGASNMKRSIPIFNSSCVMCGEEEEYSDLQYQLCYVWRRRGVFRSSIAAVLRVEKKRTAVLCVEKKRSIPIFNISYVMCGEEEEYSDLQYQRCFVWKRGGVFRSSISAMLCVEKKRSIPIFNSSCVMCGEEEEYSDLQYQLCYVRRRRGEFRSSIAAVLCVEKKRSIPIFNSSCVMCGEEEEHSDLQ